MLEENLEKELKDNTHIENNPEIKQELDVFISYSSKNKNVADAVVSNFEQNGIRCWYAPRDIMPGQEWVTAIHNAINSCKLFILIYTDSSNESRQVANEVALAFNSGKTLIPFRLSDAEMSTELEYYLTRVHWLDAVNPPLMQSIENLREYSEKILSGAKIKPSKVHNYSASKKSKFPFWVIPVTLTFITLIVVLIIFYNKDTNKNDEENDEFDIKIDQFMQEKVKDSIDQIFSMTDSITNISKQSEEQEPTDIPELTKKPSVTDEPAATEPPEVTDDPTTTEAPEITKDPVISKDPEVTKEAEVSKEPEITDPPVVTDDPEPTADPESDINRIYQLAYLYQIGANDKNNFELAYENYMKTGDEKTEDPNIAQAMYELGNRFCDGDGVDQSYEKGMQLFEKAIKSGNSSAMNAMGNLYLRGDGVDEDYEKAFKYYSKAAKSGNEIGMYNLAYMYEMGYGTDADSEKANEYYKASADKGYAPAMSKIN